MAEWTVTAFLDALRDRLVPDCDGALVRAVAERASAGAAPGGRGRFRDGRRTSVLTPSGVPFEASVSGGDGRTAAELRYVTEAGTAVPFFAHRLAAQRAAVGDLARWLAGGPAEAGAAGAELQAFLDTLFPDPGAVPARTRLAALVGVVHRPDVPGHVARLKVYGNLAADGGSLARVAERWPPFARLAGALDGPTGARAHFATLEVDASGERVHKLYLRTRLADLDGDLPDGLDRRDVAPRDERGPVYLCHRARPAGEGAGGVEGPAVSVHLPAKALGLDPLGMASLARRLAERWHGATGHVDALADAAAAAGGTWAHTVVGLGRTGGKLNVYMAPA